MQVIWRPGGVKTLTGLDWSAANAIIDPDPFWSFDPVIIADERRSLGGALFSRIRYRAWRTSFAWTVLTQAQRDDVHDWWEATDGWRQPFALRDGGTAYLGTMPVEAFPLAYIGGNPPVFSMDGRLTFEALSRVTGLAI